MRIHVIGGGVSAVHAALTLLEQGHDVELWDAGREEATFEEPVTTFHDLKGRIADPIALLLGKDLEALIPPAVHELLRYPPSRRFLAFPDDPLWSFAHDGFTPYASFAKGGLANGWGANALAYDEDDLAKWPVSFAEMDSAYRIVCERIPIAGPADDDLAPHLKGIYPTQDPIRLSATDRWLYEVYRRKKASLARAGVKLGHARLAVVTDPNRSDACDYCDRCLWGCPKGSIYNPVATTLKACQAYARFRYMTGRKVLSLLSRDGVVGGIRFVDTVTGEIRDETCGAVFLAAGALETGAIFLRTVEDVRHGMARESAGLMDTAVVKVPFVALGAIGRPPDARSFQFNRLNLGVLDHPDPWPRYLHGELLHLTSLVYHPLIERMPFDSRWSKRMFFTLKSALGVVTLFFPDRIESGNRQELNDGHAGRADIRLRYRETAEKERFIRGVVSRVRSALWRLGCVPRGAIRSPLGGGIHYAGTVPMGSGPMRCDAGGRSNLFPNVYIADGAAFPTLPSKSITMSLAAHATRIARVVRL